MANFCFQLAYKMSLEIAKNARKNVGVDTRKNRERELLQSMCVGAAPFVNFNPLSMPTYSFLWPRQTLLLPLTYSTKVDRQ
jgi:hypothetical protein